MTMSQEEWNNEASIGTQFNSWTVIGPAFPQTRKIDGATEWFVPCRCECGYFSAVRIVMLKNGHSKSCGACKGTIRGGSRRIYNIWRGMLMRCENKSHDSYELYGGRGITVSDEWHDFKTFESWSLQNGYAPKLVLDRSNNNMGYSSNNCRWVSQKVNNRNKRDNRFVTAFGETKCLMDWVNDERCEISYSGLCSRLNSGMNPEEAISTPRLNRNELWWKSRRKTLTAFGETKSYSEWGEDSRCVVSVAYLRRRVRVLGMSPEKAITFRERKRSGT